MKVPSVEVRVLRAGAPKVGAVKAHIVEVRAVKAGATRWLR